MPLLAYMILKVNAKLYFHKKSKCYKSIRANKQSMANPFRKLILISFYKILLAGIIYIALRNTEAQPNPIRFENKILDKDYFLSLEYYKDIYLIKEQEFDYMLKWHCLSKLKLKSFDKF